MTYMVKEVFATVQGEGALAGTPAVFVRFTGCNLWSGSEAHRIKHAHRNGAQCPLFCDTDFRGGRAYGADELADVIAQCGGPDPVLIVLTGGEPMLQVDEELVDFLLRSFQRTRLAIETNGTVRAAFAKRPRIWVTCSPKVPVARLTLGIQVDEVKVVYPAYNPSEYLVLPAQHRFVSPQADPSARDSEAERMAFDYVMKHPDWRLSLQLHKVLGVP